MKIVLLSTYDMSFVKKEGIGKLVSSFEEFLEKEEGTKETHIPNYINDLKKLEKDNILGICWNQTSVNQNPWYIYEEEIEIDVSGYENVFGDRKYNIFKDSLHFDLFE